MGFGPWEIVLLLLVLAIIFGVGRLSEVGRGFRKGVREFRSASEQEPVAPPAPAPPAVVVQPVAETQCPACGAANPATQAFCGQCGTRLNHIAA